MLRQIFWISVVPFTLWPPALSLAALPLQPGVYRMGSGYIQIESRGERFCYHGFSARGGAVSPIQADDQQPGYYRLLLPQFQGLLLHQHNKSTLLFGPLEQMIPYQIESNFPQTPDPALLQCLEN